jgi:regulatory protein
MPEHSDLNKEIRDLARQDELDWAHDPARARKKAMDFLARREHSAHELRQKLAKAGFDADVAAAAIDRLADDGLQSDARYVEALVHSRISQGKGPNRIRADLAQRGVAEGLVEAALAESGADWRALASEQRTRKFGAALPADFKEKARQMRFLQYRGFEPDDVRAAVETAAEA